MAQKITTIEELLGVPKGYKREIPGTFYTDKEKYIYIEDDGSGKKFGDQMPLIRKDVIVKRPSSGVMFQQGCTICLPEPDGRIFHPLSYSGDFEGWRMDIEEGSKNRNLLLAWVEGDRFVISDGKSYLLSDCKAEFY